MEFFKPGLFIDFMSQRKIWLTVSGILCALSLVFFFYPGLNLGTDFKGGTEVEVAFKKPVTAGQLRSAIRKIGFSKPDVIKVEDPNNKYRYLLRVQEVSAIDEAQKAKILENLCYSGPGGKEPPADKCPPDKRPTEVKFSPGGDKISIRYDRKPDLAAIAKAINDVPGIELRASKQNPQLVSGRDNKVEVQLKSKGDQLLDGLRKILGPETVPEAPLRVEWVGPKAGKLLRDAAIKSISIAVIFIMAYIAFRFDMRFAPGAVIAMMHDVLIVLGVFAITREEFTLTTVAALLTIQGYSVNDTVVVYDRIRENLGRHRGKPFTHIINLSISEMLSRTILTSGTTLMTLASFMFIGTGAIKDFAFAMFFGTVVGTYSSVFIAAPLTEIIDRKLFGKRRPAKKPGTKKPMPATV